VLLVAVLMGEMGCAGARVEPGMATPRAPDAAGNPNLDGGLSDTQYLFQVRYSGPEGEGSLRLVLRLREAESYQLLAADTLGRARWSLQLRQGRTLLLDHRQKTYCEGGDDLRLGEQSLVLLPVSVLPRLLLNELPLAPADLQSVEGSGEFQQSDERRWSIRRQDGVLTAWTLWIAEEPTLWWTRHGKGGILSHRDGSQFRWRQVVVEPLATGLSDLDVPTDYLQIPCDEYDLPEFRQGQSAPAGGGPSSGWLS
jgi:outer membrane biogenesis lipoprotein LolB